MDWIDNYSNHQTRKKSLSSKFQNLHLSEEDIFLENDNQPKPNINKLKSRLQIMFNSYNLTFFSEETQSKLEEQILKQFDFAIIIPTQWRGIDIFIRIEIDLQMNAIRYISYPIENSKTFNFQSSQISSISRMFSFLNNKIQYGSICINPETGEIHLSCINQIFGNIVNKINKDKEGNLLIIPLIDLEIKGIIKSWKKIIENLVLFCEIKIHKKVKEVKCKSLSMNMFQESVKQSPFNSQDFEKIMQYVTVSHLQYPFMHEQYCGQKRIKSVALSQQQKTTKKTDYQRMKHKTYFNAISFISSVQQILKTRIIPAHQKLRLQKTELVLSEQVIGGIIEHLNLQKVVTRNNIYSELEIRIIEKQLPLFKSRFSELKILQIVGRKETDQQESSTAIVSKITEPRRYTNQTNILKRMKNGKSIFITRYFHSQNLNQNNKILLQYCPEKSIDSFLLKHKKFLSLETKIFFLYQISHGLRFIRDYNVVHCDLKPQNVLVKVIYDKHKNNPYFIVKLIDFGQSIKTQDELQRERGQTFPYSAPQQINQYTTKLTEKTDVFSFGVLMYEILFQRFPFQVFLQSKKIYTEYSYLKFFTMLPERCKYYSLPKIMQVLFILCQKCLNPQPKLRPSSDWLCIIFKQILYFAGNKLYSF